MAITPTTRVRPGPAIATMTAARMKLGMTWNISAKRMRRRSTLPPKKPAVAPITMPSTEAASAAAKPTAREIWMPCAIPERTSRPSSSVPSQCSAEGGAITSSVIMPGSRPETTGYARAIAKSARMKSPPRTPERCVLKLCQALCTARSVAAAHARIEHDVDEVGHEVRGHHHEGGEEQDALQHWVVAVSDRGDEQVAEARPGEHRLDEDGAREGVAEIVADDRDDRDERIRKH